MTRRSFIKAAGGVLGLFGAIKLLPKDKPKLVGDVNRVSGVEMQGNGTDSPVLNVDDGSCTYLGVPMLGPYPYWDSQGCSVGSFWTAAQDNSVTVSILQPNVVMHLVSDTNRAE
jgi:hypothetical protein